MIEHGYQKNEWVALYSDECGDTQVLSFDLYEQAENFLKTCEWKIGIITTRLYNYLLSKDIFD